MKVATGPIRTGVLRIGSPTRQPLRYGHREDENGVADPIRTGVPRGWSPVRQPLRYDHYRTIVYEP